MNAPAPFFAACADAPPGAEAFWLHAEDGTRLRAAIWACGRAGGARGTAVVFPGRTEYIEKYGRVAGHLVERGLSVVVIDWRGQGLSDRPAGNPNLGHVEDFRHYQRDVAALLAHPRVADLPRPWYLLGHSMGGCIGSRTLLERADFVGAVFVAPMWHLQMRAATRELTTKMTKLANVLGLGGRLMPGTNSRLTALAVAFEGNALTSDPEHFAWAAAQITAHPELGLGGPSIQWTRAALEEMARLYVAPLPSVPLLVFLGSEEGVVSTSMIRSQVGRMAQGMLVDVPGARHEIFMERPEVQTIVWAEVDAFLAAVPPQRRPAANVSR